MKVYGDTLIIGVDAGYGNMKTASCIFPTGITAFDEKPFFTENLLVYKGRYYLIGSGHKEYTDQKILDEDYYVLTLASVARELTVQRHGKDRTCGGPAAHLALQPAKCLPGIPAERKEGSIQLPRYGLQH